MSFNAISNGSASQVRSETVALPPGYMYGGRVVYVDASTVALEIVLHSFRASVPHHSSADEFAEVTVSSDLECDLTAANGMGGIDDGSETGVDFFEIWFGCKADGAEPGLIAIPEGDGSPVWPTDVDYRVYLTTINNTGGAGSDIVAFDPVILKHYWEEA